MTIKIIDTDASINLFETMRSFDCTPFLSMYETIFTDIIYDEIHKGNSFKDLDFKVHALSEEEQELYNDSTTYMFGLGSGERSAMVHALFLSNEQVDRIVVISNDKEANHIFHRNVLRNPEFKEQFPNMDRILWVRTIDVIRKMWEKGLIDFESSKAIYEELKNIMGPKLKFLLQEPEI